MQHTGPVQREVNSACLFICLQVQCLRSLNQHSIAACVCSSAAHRLPFVPSTRPFTRVPGEQILELFNLHYSCIGGKEARCRLNVSASLNPLSKARCCWRGFWRFKDAFIVLPVQSSKYTIAVQGYIGAVMWVFWYTEMFLVLGSFSRAGILISVGYLTSYCANERIFCIQKTTRC